MRQKYLINIYINDLDEYKRCPIVPSDTVYSLKRRILGPDCIDFSFKILEISGTTLSSHGNYVLHDKIKIFHEIISRESGTMRHFFLILRDCRFPTSVRTPWAYRKGSVNPFQLPLIGCTEWLYVQVSPTSYSPFSYIPHWKCDTFEQRLFMVICDSSSIQGKLRREYYSKRALQSRDGYYSFAGNSLWFENSSGDPLSSLNMINNVTSVQLMEDSKDIFNVNYTVLKSEESAYFASVDGSHLAENWARAINANNVNDQVDNSIMNAEMTIASSQLTASERYVKTIVDFHDMLMSLANPFIRRKYWKLLSSLNEQAYLHFWELIEDYRLRLSDKSLKHNEKEILHRASAIYNSFLSNSSPCFLARLSSSSRSDIQMKLRDGRADGNLFVGVQKETMLFLSQMFFDNFIPKHKSFIQRMEIYLSFIDDDSEQYLSNSSARPNSSTPSSTPTTSGFWNPVSFLTRLGSNSSKSSLSSASNNQSSSSRIRCYSEIDDGKLESHNLQSENQFKVWSNQDVSQARADKDWWRKIWQNRKTLHSQSQSGLFDELEDDLCVRQSIGVGWIPHDLSSILNWAFQGHDLSSSSEERERESENEPNSEDHIAMDYFEMNSMKDPTLNFGLGSIRKIGSVLAKYCRPKINPNTLNNSSNNNININDSNGNNKGTVSSTKVPGKVVIGENETEIGEDINRLSSNSSLVSTPSDRSKMKAEPDISNLSSLSNSNPNSVTNTPSSYGKVLDHDVFVDAFYEPPTTADSTQASVNESNGAGSINTISNSPSRLGSASTVPTTVSFYSPSQSVSTNQRSMGPGSIVGSPMNVTNSNSGIQKALSSSSSFYFMTNSTLASSFQEDSFPGSRERCPSDEFVGPSGGIEWRSISLLFTLWYESVAKLVILMNGLIVARIHLINLVRLSYALEDPRCLLLEDISGAQWKLRPNGMDDIDAFEQTRQWHYLIAAYCPPITTKECIEAVGSFSKRGRINTAFKRRWFILVSDNRNCWKLRYYKDENSMIYKGEIDLSIINTVECDFMDSLTSFGVLIDPDNNNHAHNGAGSASSSTASSTSSPMMFRLLRSNQMRSIYLKSDKRVWEISTESFSLAETWYDLLRRVVIISKKFPYSSRTEMLGASHEEDDEEEDDD